MSGDQRRRLDLALAVAGDPELIFLDEPTTGFDPSARRNAWLLIENLRSLGKTILLTTHYMDEAQHLADRVGVLARGRGRRRVPPAMLAGRQNGTAVIRFRLPPGVDVADLPVGAIEVEADDERLVSLRTDRPTAALRPLLDWAAGRGEESRLDRHPSDARGRLPRADGGHGVSRRSDLRLAWLWFRGRLLLLARTPRVTFFTIVFPLILVVLFNALNDSKVSILGGKVAFAQFFTPSMAIFSMTTATYTAVIFGVATARGQGVLKRVTGTPLPMSMTCRGSARRS